MSDINRQPSTINSVKERQCKQRLWDLQQETLPLFERMVESGILTSTTGDKLDWEDVVWVYRVRKLWFCKLTNSNGQKMTRTMYFNSENIEPLNAEMATWAKCYIVHLLKKNSNYSPTHVSRFLRPLRWIAVYTENSFETLTRFDQFKLEQFWEYIVSQGIYSSHSLYTFCRDLTFVLNWTSRIQLLTRVIKFRVVTDNPRTQQLDVTTKAFAEHREKKFPDSAFINAVSAIKQKLIADPELEPKPGYDWIRIHTIPFKLALGLRIQEVMTLPVNALYEEEESGKLYLRVWTAKGQLPTLRYIPKIWGPAIKESYHALLALCRSARELAEEIETSNSFSFIENRLKEQDRSQKDINRLLQCGFDPKEYYYTRELAVVDFKHRNFMRKNRGKQRDLLEETGYPGKKWQKVVSVKRLLHWFEERYNRILSIHYKENILNNTSDNAGKVNATLSSRSFCHKQPLHKHLIVVFDQQFNNSKRGVALLPTPMTNSHIYNYYAPGAGRKTIFERLDIRNSRGEMFSITPHQFRHWLTTSLQREGANDMVIDRWMGREIGQNRTYDNRTGKERAEAIREIYLQRDGIPNDYLGKKIQRMRLHDIEEAIVRDTVNEFISVAHFTPWGFCSRDLAVTPCNRSIQCLKGFDSGDPCRHFHIDPTDMKSKENIERLLNQYEHQLKILIPEYEKDDFEKELNLTEPLDQHIHHALQIIHGCRSALKAFELDDCHDLIWAGRTKENVTITENYSHEGYESD